MAYASIGGPPALFVVALSQPAATGPALLAPLLAILVATLLLAAFLSLALGRSLIHPLSELRETLDRLQAGDLQAQVPVESDDELGRLAASHNRLAATLAGRNRALAVVSQAFAPALRRRPARRRSRPPPSAPRGRPSASPPCSVRLGQPPDETPPERVPGEAFDVEAPLAMGDEVLGAIRGTLPPTRDWGEADQDLLRVLGIQLAGAIRNAELFDATAELAELKNEFLRGVSHNLQTPLTSIRAFAGQLADETGDRRLGIIVEQSERLSRLVAQLLTVTKIEAGTLKPDVDVFPMGALVRRAWESLGHPTSDLALDDGATGWLAAADRDWVEQVVWALLDNALRYGGRRPGRGPPRAGRRRGGGDAPAHHGARPRTGDRPGGPGARLRALHPAGAGHDRGQRPGPERGPRPGRGDGRAAVAGRRRGARRGVHLQPARRAHRGALTDAPGHHDAAIRGPRRRRREEDRRGAGWGSHPRLEPYRRGGP